MLQRVVLALNRILINLQKIGTMTCRDGAIPTCILNNDGEEIGVPYLDNSNR